MLIEIDKSRRHISASTDAARKAELGQFFTPAATARFMASLFSASTARECRLLDPGAGIGSLTAAFLDRWIAGGFGFESAHVTACEIDSMLRETLASTLTVYRAGIPLAYEAIGVDFIEYAVNRLQFDPANEFTHAIVNPPYRKIGTQSRHRLLLRQVGIETVNLYSAFVALALELLRPGGELVAIVPRSFCNGPYYKPFRDFVLQRAAIRHLHLFAARDKAFKDDGVLQENVIMLLERGGLQQELDVSTSSDDRFDDYRVVRQPFGSVIVRDDPDRFIRFPSASADSALENRAAIRYTLADIGVSVSTGPIVDFRLKEHIRESPERGTVPLLYPSHFSGKTLQWPKENTKKPNAILRNAETEKWLYPTGFYCVVRRFSSKEERRRIVACVVDQNDFGGADALGFENHLNVFHTHKKGLAEELAHGLAAFLNTTAVDDYFRRFNGHTQVNATDLRSIRYPSRTSLVALGQWAIASGELSQAMIDGEFMRVTG